MTRSTQWSHGDEDLLPDRVVETLPDDHGSTWKYEQVIAILRGNDGRVNIMDLTRELVERNRQSPSDVPTEDYQSTYLSLRSQCLPTLVTLDLVEYDENDGSVILIRETEPRRARSS